MDIPFNEITEFFLSIEDIFLNEQKRVNRKIENFLETGLKNAKTANDAKELLERTFLTFIELLPDYSDLVFSASFYLPKCIEERNRAKKYYKQVFRKIIKKGWPGKIDAVLDRPVSYTHLTLPTIYSV